MKRVEGGYERQLTGHGDLEVRFDVLAPVGGCGIVISGLVACAGFGMMALGTLATVSPIVNEAPVLVALIGVATFAVGAYIAHGATQVIVRRGDGYGRVTLTSAGVTLVSRDGTVLDRRSARRLHLRRDGAGLLLDVAGGAPLGGRYPLNPAAAAVAARLLDRDLPPPASAAPPPRTADEPPSPPAGAQPTPPLAADPIAWFAALGGGAACAAMLGDANAPAMLIGGVCGAIALGLCSLATPRQR